MEAFLVIYLTGFFMILILKMNMLWDEDFKEKFLKGVVEDLKKDSSTSEVTNKLGEATIYNLGRFVLVISFILWPLTVMYVIFKRLKGK